MSDALSAHVAFMTISPRARARLFTLARLLISLLLLWILIRGFDFARLQETLRQANPFLIGAAAVVLVASPATSLPRWAAILRQLGHPIARAALARALYVGAFFSQVLPSTVGGDVWRVWACSRAGVPLGMATYSVLLERLAGVLAILLFVAAGLPSLLSHTGATLGTLVPWLAVVIAVVAGIAALVLIAERNWATGLLAPLVGLGKAFAVIGRSPGTLGLMLVTGIAGQLVAVLAMYLIARGVGAPLSFADCAVTLAPALLIAMVPVSLGGWGVREGAFAVILNYYDIPREQAVTLSVLFGLALAASSLVGLVLWWRQPSAPL